ncbi:MAG: hypothetical protein U9R66_01565, partial [Thermodesulfobacteriota bacterium]|nr:hypothetical protein [Thermodesulfobacteriota bacterium]
MSMVSQGNSVVDTSGNDLTRSLKTVTTQRFFCSEKHTGLDEDVLCQYHLCSSVPGLRCFLNLEIEHLSDLKETRIFKLSDQM